MKIYLFDGQYGEFIFVFQRKELKIVLYQSHYTSSNNYIGQSLTVVPLKLDFILFDVRERSFEAELSRGMVDGLKEKVDSENYFM